MIKSNKTMILVILLLTSIIMSGCLGSQQNPSDTITETNRTVIDQKGREVEIPKEINSVVSTYGPATNLIFAVGAQHKLVAVPDKTHSNKFFTSVYPEVLKLDEIGSRGEGLNIEAVIASNPDVVILFPGNDNETIIEQLATQKIPAVVINPESIEEILECIELLGDVLGREAQAKELIAYYIESLELVESRVSNISLDQRKKVYLAGSNGLLSTTSSDMYQHHLIEQAGGINVASSLNGGWNQVSAEQLIKFNPDFITSVQYSKGNVAQEISDNKQFSNIEAIKNKQVYIFPSNLGGWDMPEPRSILGILWLSNMLYPEEFTDMDILKEIEEFHLNFYGKNFTELGGILNDNEILEKIK